MRTLIRCLCALSLAVPMMGSAKAAPATEPAPAVSQAADRELVAISRQKWDWMAQRRIAELDALFDDQAVFVHMGGAMSKTAELKVIRSGAIQYKHAEIKDVSTRVIGSTAIVLSQIRLTAIVGGQEVVNPFMVTEVYVRAQDQWKLGSLSFTRLLTN